ncbi:MAG: MMPL family transporter [Chloroflexota bacterium]
MKGFFPVLGDLVARLRWVVLIVWIAFVGVSLVGARHVKDSLISGGINVPGSESDEGNKLLEAEFNRRPTRAAAALFTSKSLVVTDQAYRDAATRALDEIKKLEGVDDVFSVFTHPSLVRLVSEDKHTSYAVVNFAGTEEDVKKLVPKVREILQKDRPNTVDMYLIGFPATSYDISTGSAHDLERAELTSLPLTVFLLVLVFGTLVAAGLPIILGLAAVVTALAGIYVVAQRMETSIFAMNTASMIGLGLGIDFSLLMVSRYREELAKGLRPHDATVRTVATAGQAIVFSGLTVMLGLAVMLLYDLVLIRSIALGMLMVAGLAVLGAVTLLPALLCIFGRGVNALNLIPGRSAAPKPNGPPGRWHAWSLLVMRQPWPFLLLSTGLLIAMGIPTKDMFSIGAGGPQGVGKEAESRRGFEVLSEAFPIGEVSPISVVVKTSRSGDAFDPTIKEGIWRLTRQLEPANDERVARVESAANLTPNSAMIPLEQFKAITPEQLSADPNRRAAANQYVNLDRARDTFLVSVISKNTDTDTNSTDLVRHIRDKVVPAIPELKNTKVYVTGNTALSLDYRDKLYGQFPILVGLVLLVTYVVLLLFFHSLLLPLKAILMNVVSIIASYGFMVMVFQWGILDKVMGFEHLGRLSMFPPVILFSILFGLSTDYEVFLLSRVKELYRQKAAVGDPNANEHSVAEGLEHTAGIITAAGLLMIVVFGAFAMAEVLVIKELGVGLAVAVLLDSTIIRVMMVPASMRLMGSVNWWIPKWLDWIPELDPEGGAEEHAPVGHAAMFCRQCGTALPSRARFCGACGAQTQQPPAYEGAAVAQPWVTDRTIANPSFAGDRAMAGPARQRASGAPVHMGPTGFHKLSVVIQIGQVRRDAYLILRDCHVERDPNRPDIPIMSFLGVDVMPMQGGERPEIEIRNARVRY